MVAYSNRGANIFLLVHVVLLLGILYEINDFGNHVSMHLSRRRAYNRMAADARCFPEPVDEDSVNVVTVSCNGVVATCLEAREKARAFILGQAFKSWSESRYLYKLLTMESRVTQVMVILLLAWTIHVAGKYYIAVYQTNHLALPYRYAPSPAGHAFLHNALELLFGDRRQIAASSQPVLQASNVYSSIDRYATPRVQELTD